MQHSLFNTLSQFYTSLPVYTVSPPKTQRPQLKQTSGAALCDLQFQGQFVLFWINLGVVKAGVELQGKVLKKMEGAGLQDKMQSLRGGDRMSLGHRGGGAMECVEVTKEADPQDLMWSCRGRSYCTYPVHGGGGTAG